MTDYSETGSLRKRIVIKFPNQNGVDKTANQNCRYKRFLHTDELSHSSQSEPSLQKILHTNER